MNKIENNKRIIFDYTGAELLLEHHTTEIDNTENIISNPGYKHILEHSRKYSSMPLTEQNLRNSLNGNYDGFDFTHISARKDEFISIIDYLKSNEQQIREVYSQLCLNYLPNDYEQKSVIYYVIGGYNGIAFDDKICININFEPFRNNFKEIELYIAHELFHIGFEKYQSLPDIFKAQTVADLKEIVLLMTMNEGLATLTPYHKRLEIGEISDYDYQILLNKSELSSKIRQFDSILDFMDENSDKNLDNAILGKILGQCSGDRLFYIVGCHMGLTIEQVFGAEEIKQLIMDGYERFFEVYKKTRKIGKTEQN